MAAGSNQPSAKLSLRGTGLTFFRLVGMRKRCHIERKDLDIAR